MADKKRRATHMDELERFQMEEAIRESEGRLEPSAAASSSAAETSLPPPASTSRPPRTTSPRTTQLLNEVGEITLILVA
eukprot:1308425-Alexandrium_andersonii.AAC.1